MKHICLSIIGFGVVGQGLAELLTTKQALLRHDFGLEVTLISVANARHGFIYREDGLDIPTLLELAAARRPLTEHPGIQHWAHPLDGLQATGGDLTAKANRNKPPYAEPGKKHIRGGLSQGMEVIPCNKGPSAPAGQELFGVAQQPALQLGIESTGEGGTPVLSTIREGMA